MTTGWTLLGHWFLPIQKSIRGCAEIHVVCAGVCVCVRIAQTCLLRFFLFMSVFLFTSYPQCTCPNDNKTGLNICRSIERAWPQQWVHTEVTDESVSASVSTYELCNTKVSISFGHSIFYFRNKKWVIKWWFKLKYIFLFNGQREEWKIKWRNIFYLMESNKKQNCLERQMEEVVLFHILMDVVPGKTRVAHVPDSVSLAQVKMSLEPLSCVWDFGQWWTQGVRGAGGKKI